MSDGNAQAGPSYSTRIVTTVFTTVAGVVLTWLLRIALARYLIARRARRRQATLHNKPGPGEEQPHPTFFDVWEEDGRRGSNEGIWSEIIVRYFW
jgi:hypothetical protein